MADSGWTAAITDANIASSGVADSLPAASHLSRTRHAHEVTACSLHIIMKKAYTRYVERENRMKCFHLKTGRLQGLPAVPSSSTGQSLLILNSLFSYLYSQYVVETLRSTKMLCQRSFHVFFALDHTNYVRWLPVHLRDVMQLAMKHLNLESEFEAGNFVVHKTQCVHSGIAIDHAHEQNNKCVKGDGGAIGLTENSSELLPWMIAGPEIARIIAEFEISKDIRSSKTKCRDTLHHEQSRSAQSKFEQQVHALCDTMEKNVKSIH